MLYTLICLLNIILGDTSNFMSVSRWHFTAINKEKKKKIASAKDTYYANICLPNR